MKPAIGAIKSKPPAAKYIGPDENLLEAIPGALGILEAIYGAPDPDAERLEAEQREARHKLAMLELEIDQDRARLAILAARERRERRNARRAENARKSRKAAP